MATRILMCVCWAILCPVSRAKTYYIDANSGNDSNAGTSSSEAWRTIAKVSGSQFSPGDIVLFRRGDTWREQLNFPSSGRPGHSIVIDAFGEGTLPVISGSDLVPSGAWSACKHCASPVWQAAVSVQPNVVIFDGVKGNKRTALNDLSKSHDWYWEASTLYVFSSISPGSAYQRPGVECGARPTGINLTGLSFVTVRNIHVSGANAPPYTTGSGIWAYAAHLAGPAPHDLSIQHVVVVNCAGDGIHMENANRTTIELSLVASNGFFGILLHRTLAAFPIDSGVITNNEVHHNQHDGIAIGGCPQATTCRSVVNAEPVQVAGLTISGNKVYNNGAGIYLLQTIRSVVTDNLSYANTDTTTRGEGLCVGLSGSSSNIVEKNHCYQARASAIELSIDTGNPPLGSSDNIIRYNIIHDDGTNGVFTNHMPSHHNRFTYNIIYNHPNGSCFMANYMDHEFYNNTCVNNRFGILLYISSTTPQTGNITVKNNILLNCTQSNVVIEPKVQGPLVFDTNEYYPDGPTKFRWMEKDTDFNGWRVNSRQDGHSFVGDPQLNSPAPSTPSDFALSPNSPAIGKGAELGSDFDKALAPGSRWPGGVRVASQDKRWDLGAIRYQP